MIENLETSASSRYLRGMSDVTQILSQIEQGDTAAANQLLPLVYDELRKLANARLAREKPGQTLQATALVHDAYVRLVDTRQVKTWDSRGHFFAAAAEAMRRILIEQARKKRGPKAGGDHRRVELSAIDANISSSDLDLVDLSDALDVLESQDARAARVVKLRFFAGLTIPRGRRRSRHLGGDRQNGLALRQELAESGSC